MGTGKKTHLGDRVELGILPGAVRVLVVRDQPLTVLAHALVRCRCVQGIESNSDYSQQSTNRHQKCIIIISRLLFLKYLK